MSEAKERSDKRPKGKGADPTRSFDGSTPGPGSRIGPFRIERELGRGGAGVVYLAHDTKLDRSVAIKSLRNYQDALRRVSLRSEEIDTQDFFIPLAMQYASIYGYMKNDLAKKYYDEGLKIVEAKIRQEPDDARLHSALGIAYAGLGRKQEAIREGKLAVDLLPVSKDAMRGICRVGDLARIYVMVGEFDSAIKQIEILLSQPSELSIDLLRLDPAWAPLRDHPRFKRLLEGK